MQQVEKHINMVKLNLKIISLLWGSVAMVQAGIKGRYVGSVMKDTKQIPT